MPENFYESPQIVFIRWLLIRNEAYPQEKRFVIDIEYIQSGNNRRVSSLEEADKWLKVERKKSKRKIGTLAISRIKTSEK